MLEFAFWPLIWPAVIAVIRLNALIPVRRSVLVIRTCDANLSLKLSSTAYGKPSTIDGNRSVSATVQGVQPAGPLDLASVNAFNLVAPYASHPPLIIIVPQGAVTLLALDFT